MTEQEIREQNMFGMSMDEVEGHLRERQALEKTGSIVISMLSVLNIS